MSELFDEEAGDGKKAPPQAPPRRSRALIITAAMLVVGFFSLTTFASFFTDRLWYDAIGYSGVFSTPVLDPRRAVPRVRRPDGAGRRRQHVRRLPVPPAVPAELAGADRPRPLPRGRHPDPAWLLIGVSVLLGLFAGTSANGQWRQYLLWRNGGDFGTKDAYFERDIGFYVFDLPWLHYLSTPRWPSSWSRC